MTNTDHDLRAERILLATKALDILTKALDLLAADEPAVSNSTPQERQPETSAPHTPTQEPQPNPAAPHTPPQERQPETTTPHSSSQEHQIEPAAPHNTPQKRLPSQPDTYRADSIRFNEQYLRDHFDLRYNTMLKTTEFRPRSASAPVPEGFPEGLPECTAPAAGEISRADSVSGGLPAGECLPEDTAPWRPITDRDLNALTVGQLLAGGQSWTYGMRLCIDSTRVESFNPVTDYLGSLPAWDGRRDYIADLAARVPTHYKEWPQLFRRWFLAMVAQARGMSPDHGNSLVPLLIGAQGTGKSTFCKMLLPRSLRQYYMDDIKMDNAEQVERVLGRMWLVNIDEYDSKTQREQSKIKRLLTERDVQVRRPRSDQYVLTPRVCSFIATTNDDRPLSDPTGSRRYLCVELSGAIDTTTPVPHDQLFAQALYELEHGAPFFLTREEEAMMEAHNEQYCRHRVLENAVRTILEPAPVSRDTLQSSSDIEDLLSSVFRPQDMPSPKLLVAALRSAGFRSGAQQGKHGWYVRRRPSDAAAA